MRTRTLALLLGATLVLTPACSNKPKDAPKDAPQDVSETPEEKAPKEAAAGDTKADAEQDAGQGADAHEEPENLLPMRFGWKAGDRFGIKTTNTHEDVAKDREKREMSIEVGAVWTVEQGFQSLKIVPSEFSHSDFSTSVQSYGLQWASTSMLSHATPFLIPPDGKRVVRVVDTSVAMNAIDAMLEDLGADSELRDVYKKVAHGSIKETGSDLWNLMIAEWYSGESFARPGYVRRRFEDVPCVEGEETMCAKLTGVERRERDTMVLVRTADVLIEPDGMYPRELDITIEASDTETGFASTRTVSMTVTRLPDAPPSKKPKTGSKAEP